MSDRVTPCFDIAIVGGGIVGLALAMRASRRRWIAKDRRWMTSGSRWRPEVIHVLNVPSPAATASLAVAEHILARALEAGLLPVRDARVTVAQPVL